MTIHDLNLISNPAIQPNQFAGTRPSLNGSSHEKSRWPVAILGVAFDPVTMDDTLRAIKRMVASGRPHYIVTPNVDFLVQAMHDRELRQILLEANLVLCDGTPLVWASRWLGNPLPERVAGSDMVPRLLEQAREHGHRVFLLGATPESNEAATARLGVDYPGLEVAGHYSPPFRPLDEMDNEDIIRRVQEARPDILLVSLGCPKQEKWMARHYHELGVPVCIGVGAVIDFLAGRVRRAPHWMHSIGLEWVYRACQEPRRLVRRYAIDFRHFIPAILSQCWQTRHWMRMGSHRGSMTIDRWESQWVHARLAGALDLATIESDAGKWRELESNSHDCAMDLRGVEYIDSTGVAMLWEQRKRVLGSGHRFVLEEPSVPVRHALSSMGIAEFFEIHRPRHTIGFGNS